MFRTTFDSANKVWSGKSIAPVFNPNVSVGQVVLWMLQRNPNKYSQVFVNAENCSLSYVIFVFTKSIQFIHTKSCRSVITMEFG